MPSGNVDIVIDTAIDTLAESAIETSSDTELVVDKRHSKAIAFAFDFHICLIDLSAFYDSEVSQIGLGECDSGAGTIPQPPKFPELHKGHSRTTLYKMP